MVAVLTVVLVVSVVRHQNSCAGVCRHLLDKLFTALKRLKLDPSEGTARVGSKEPRPLVLCIINDDDQVLGHSVPAHLGPTVHVVDHLELVHVDTSVEVMRPCRILQKFCEYISHVTPTNSLFVYSERHQSIVFLLDQVKVRPEHNRDPEDQLQHV